MKYKNFNIPDEEIDKLMDSLDISLEEACETYLFDHDMMESKEVDEMSKKASKNRITATIHGAKGEKKERKPREKKENPLKKEIISALFKGINAFLETKDSEFTTLVTNDEKYIDFSIDGREFTINLVEHRKKKDK